MGKNKRKVIVYDDIEFDSSEEIEFYMWIKEGIQYGLIHPEWDYQPIVYDLIPKSTVLVTEYMKTKDKTVEKSLFQSHEYTPDFRIRFTDMMFEVMNHEKRLDYPICISVSGYKGFRYVEPNQDVIIDVKGGFNKVARSFSIDQKLVYDRYGVIIHQIIPLKLFKNTWVPNELRLTPKQQKPRKHYYELQTIDQFISTI